MFILLTWQYLQTKRNKRPFFSLYKVKPVKINILPIPYKNIISKGKKGTRGGGKKAVVYLKKKIK